LGSGLRLGLQLGLRLGLGLGLGLGWGMAEGIRRAEVPKGAAEADEQVIQLIVSRAAIERQVSRRPAHVHAADIDALPGQAAEAHPNLNPHPHPP